MRVADYIVERLQECGADHIFGVTGGMIMHLTDAIYRRNEVGSFPQFVACHHEAAAVMAADAYGRYSGKIGAAFVTAGPGALNALTGVAGAYVDSAPVVVVAGQSVLSQARVQGPRQYALQGFNTLPIFKQVTKLAVMVTSPSDVRRQVDWAIRAARSGRPGPVWIEVPVDMQGVEFPSGPKYFDINCDTSFRLDEGCALAANALKASKRPVLLVGAGVRSSGAASQFVDLVCDRRLPYMTSRLGMDLGDHEDPFFVGRPGTYGDRPANFAVQNADLLLVVGCRLGAGLVGYNPEGFAPHAIIVMVDADGEELVKPGVTPHVAIKADARAFLKLLNLTLEDWRFTGEKWHAVLDEWKARYSVVPEASAHDGINSYRFMSRFSECMPQDARFVVDTGSCFHVHAQAFKVKRGQRHIITGGLSTMGFMPAAIGVAAAAPGQPVYCITGDGSLQMHLQELATIAHHQFPVKLVVFNNGGYLLIRNTQKNFQDGRLIGEGPETGVSFPSLRGLADLYGFRYVPLAREEDIATAVDVMNRAGPAILDVKMPRDQLLAPRVQAKLGPDGKMVPGVYDDMFPFLPRDEYEAQQVWRDWKED